MKEPGQEEMRFTVEKKDFNVDKRLPVSFYRVDVQSFSVRGQVSVCCVCKHKVRPSEVPLLLT